MRLLSDLFSKTSTAFTNRSAFASPTEWQDPGEDRLQPPPAYVIWNCLGFRSVGEVLILLRHCICVGSGSFCHDWASHCSVLFWTPPFAPLDSLRMQQEGHCSGDILNCSICLIWIGNVHRFWTPKAGSPRQGGQGDDEPPAQAEMLGDKESAAPATGAPFSATTYAMPLDKHGVKRHEHADEIDQTKRARRTCTKDTTTDETNKQKLNQVASTDFSSNEHEDMSVSEHSATMSWTSWRRFQSQ